MKITKSKLRRLIRRVLLENINVERMTLESFTDPSNLEKYLDSGESVIDFLKSNHLKENAEDVMIKLKLMSMLIGAYFMDGGSGGAFGRSKVESIMKYSTLTEELEYVWGIIEECLEDEQDTKELDQMIGRSVRFYLGGGAFNSPYEMRDFVKSIGESEKAFGINASKLLLDFGCALSDNDYNYNIIDKAIKPIRAGYDFFGVVRELEKIRELIDRGLKSGEFVEMYMRYMGEMMGIEAGDREKSKIEMMLEIDSDYDFSHSIYHMGRPYEYMQEIFDFMGKISYVNHLVGRF